MQRLRPSAELALDEAIREWPSSRYQRQVHRKHGVCEVIDVKTRELVATVYGVTDEPARDEP